MHDIEFLSRTLTLQEFEEAKATFDKMVSQGHAPVKAAAMLYRQGLLSGKRVQKEKQRLGRERWKAQQAQQKQSKANVKPEPVNQITAETAQEGGNENE